GLMSIVIVKKLKIIYIQNHQGKIAVKPLGPEYLFIQALIEISIVEDAGHAIGI
ncbi:unnamed protein product, partial [marine sediment metagenome]